MILKKKLSAIKVPHHKNTANAASVRIAPPKEVILPMTMHAGAAAVPLVKPGDHVLMGQLIAEEGGRNSSPVYASVSGEVTAVGPVVSGGKSVTGICIRSDGKMEKDPSLYVPQVHDLDSFLAETRRSGVVGLGGGAFPVWAKLDAVRRNKIQTVLINGAECEPFATSDNRTMLEMDHYIAKGVELLRTFLQAERFVIGIESNKPEAIANLKKVFQGDASVEVMPLDSCYPQGAKQVLLYNATGKVVQAGQRLASLGVIIINVTSLAKVAEYMETGMPMVERCVTVDGSAIKEPANLLVPIGTPIRDLIAAAGGLSCEAGKIILGGPMMGTAVSSLDEPVVKATNAVLVFNRADAKVLEPSACIHCGRCVEACPLNLDPTSFARALQVEDDAQKYALLQQSSIATCMECGCCSFVCPAHRPLVANNRQGKSFSRAYKAQLEKQKEEVK